jgi:outer membrane biosynthesis protein TonB
LAPTPALAAAPPEPPLTPVTPPPFIPTPTPAPAVEPDVARALRVYDAFPDLPARAVRERPELDVKVCVSTQGDVSNAEIVRGPSDPSLEPLRAAILRWRYRPFTPAGTPTPFCHVMRISYRMN